MRTLNFDELNLHSSTLDELKNANLTEATSLQQTIISNSKEGQHLVINADAESEKNSAYAIASLEQLRNREEQEGTAILIITGTPQAAREICDEITSLSSEEVNCIVADDEGNHDEQAEALSKEPTIIVANPGRLQSLLQEHRFIFRKVNLFILDGLDEMVNNGQSDNLKRLKRRVLSDYTSLICSGNYNSDIEKVASSFTDDPSVIGFGSTGSNAGSPPSIAGHIQQGYINVPYRMKISTLMAHIDQEKSNTCVIFTASKRGTDRLYRVLKKRGLKATSLHGKLSDEKRAQRFANFTNGNVQYLLVADISAAELDLSNVEQVLNYDVPNTSDEYRYRAALLGTGKSVRIVSLVSKQDRSDISELQNELGQTPDEIPLPDEVKKKLKKRKQNKSSNGQQKKKRGNKKQQRSKKDDMQLPKPSYDKLSGGRSGNHDDEKTGIVKFFKKLFS